MIKSTMVVFSMALILSFSNNSFADHPHPVTELVGEWYSSIFPETTHYEFFGVKELKGDLFIVHHVRGNCTGSGLMNLETGSVRTVEVCPPRGAGQEELIFFNLWHIHNEHGDLHLKGGYYSQGSSQFRGEDLDKDVHGSGGGN